MGTLLRRVSTYAFGRARGGSHAWFRVALGVTALRLVGTLVRRREDAVQFRLRAGDSVVVRDLGRGR